MKKFNVIANQKLVTVSTIEAKNADDLLKHLDSKPIIDKRSYVDSTNTPLMIEECDEKSPVTKTEARIRKRIYNSIFSQFMAAIPPNKEDTSRVKHCNNCGKVMQDYSTGFQSGLFRKDGWKLYWCEVCGTLIVEDDVNIELIHRTPIITKV